MFLESHEKNKEYPTHEEVDAEQLDPNNSLAVMAALVGERKRVLDVGCAGGYFAKLLSRRGCEVIGIDANPEAVERAHRFCVSAYAGDLDRAHLRDILPAALRFDVVVFGDVLEHLRDPMRLLEEARSLLTEEGYVVASIPNVAHGAVRLSLLSGAFDYQRLGILDDTHLRFFTAKTVEELFLSAGFRLTRVERTKLPIFASSELLPRVDREDFAEAVVEQVLADAESETLQFVVQAHPLAENARMRALTKRFLEVNTDVAAMRRTAARHEAELERTRAHLSTADAEMHRVQAMHAALLEETRVEQGRIKSAYEKEIGELRESAQRGKTFEVEHARLLERADHLARERAGLRSIVERLEPLESAYARLEEREALLKASLVEIRAGAEREREAKTTLLQRETALVRMCESLRGRVETAEELAAERAGLLEAREGESARASAEVVTLHGRVTGLEGELTQAFSLIVTLHGRAEAAEALAAERAMLLEASEGESTRLSTEVAISHGRVVALEEDLTQAFSLIITLRGRAERVEDVAAEQAALLEAYAGEITALQAKAEKHASLLAEHVASATAESQTESARLALLIDTVQSSRFWRLKRLFGRIFRRRAKCAR